MLKNKHKLINSSLLISSFIFLPVQLRAADTATHAGAHLNTYLNDLNQSSYNGTIVQVGEQLYVLIDHGTGSGDAVIKNRQKGPQDQPEPPRQSCALVALYSSLPRSLMDQTFRDARMQLPSHDYNPVLDAAPLREAFMRAAINKLDQPHSITTGIQTGSATDILLGNQTTGPLLQGLQTSSDDNEKTLKAYLAEQSKKFDPIDANLLSVIGPLVTGTKVNIITPQQAMVPNPTTIKVNGQALPLRAELTLHQSGSEHDGHYVLALPVTKKELSTSELQNNKMLPEKLSARQKNLWPFQQPTASSSVASLSSSSPVISAGISPISSSGPSSALRSNPSSSTSSSSQAASSSVASLSSSSPVISAGISPISSSAPSTALRSNPSSSTSSSSQAASSSVASLSSSSPIISAGTSPISSSNPSSALSNSSSSDRPISNKRTFIDVDDLDNAPKKLKPTAAAPNPLEEEKTRCRRQERAEKRARQAEEQQEKEREEEQWFEKWDKQQEVKNLAAKRQAEEERKQKIQNELRKVAEETEKNEKALAAQKQVAERKERDEEAARKLQQEEDRQFEERKTKNEEASSKAIAELHKKERQEHEARKARDEEAARKLQQEEDRQFEERKKEQAEKDKKLIEQKRKANEEEATHKYFEAEKRKIEDEASSKAALELQQKDFRKFEEKKTKETEASSKAIKELQEHEEREAKAAAQQRLLDEQRKNKEEEASNKAILKLQRKEQPRKKELEEQHWKAEARKQELKAEARKQELEEQLRKAEARKKEQEEKQRKQVAHLVTPKHPTPKHVPKNQHHSSSASNPHSKNR
ncbi:MAG: hypothetical protein RLZ12_351 [Bacillota bacterium]